MYWASGKLTDNQYHNDAFEGVGIKKHKITSNCIVLASVCSDAGAQKMLRITAPFGLWLAELRGHTSPRLTKLLHQP